MIQFFWEQSLKTFAPGIRFSNFEMRWKADKKLRAILPRGTNVGPPVIFLQPITIVTLDFFWIPEKNMVFNFFHYYCVTLDFFWKRELVYVEKTRNKTEKVTKSS